MTASLTDDRAAPLDDIISAVADEHRRATLRVLNNADGGPMDLAVLADRIVERVDSGGLPPEEHRRRVRTSLHQMHLPKLDAYGMLQYDTDTREVRGIPGELSQELLAVIDSYRPGE